MSQAVESLKERSREFATKAHETHNTDLRYWFEVASEDLRRAAQWLEESEEVGSKLAKVITDRAKDESARTPGPATDHVCSLDRIVVMPTPNTGGACPDCGRLFRGAFPAASVPARLLAAAEAVVEGWRCNPRNERPDDINDLADAIADREPVGKGGAS